MHQFRSLILVILILSLNTAAIADGDWVSTYWGNCIGNVGDTFDYPNMSCTVTSQGTYETCVGGVLQLYCVQKFSCTPFVPFDPNLPNDIGPTNSPLSAALGNRGMAPNLIGD